MADHASSFLLISILTIVTVLLIFAMRTFAASRQVRLQVASDAAYRELAAKAAATQSECADALSDIKARLATVEKILKEVG